MKTRISAILTALLFFGAAVPAYATWDITSDTNIYGGFYDFINIYDTPPDHTTVNIYDVNSDYIATYDESTLNFFGGHADAGACDYSFISISGGTRNGAEAYNYATLNFFGTAIASYISAYDLGTVNMTGGTVDAVGVSQSGIANIYAGDVIDRLWATESGVINIYGHDLFKTDFGGTYGYGQVYGYLTDDTYIDVDLSNSDAYSHINLIPEPTTFALFGIGSLILLRKNNSKNNTKYS